MISHPGDNRTALIAALIAIPSAALITMVIHTFVPIQSNGNMGSYPAAAEAKPHRPEGSRGFKGEGKRGGQGFDKENFKKMFMERYKKQTDSLQKIANLSKKQCQLLKQKKAPDREILQAETGYLLAQAALFRHQAKIRSTGSASAVDLAIRTVGARKLAQLDAAACKAGKGCEIAALKSEIAALQLELQLTASRLNRNPQWKEALAAYQKQQNDAALKAMIEVERSAQPPRRGMK